MPSHGVAEAAPPRPPAFLTSQEKSSSFKLQEQVQTNQVLTKNQNQVEQSIWREAGVCIFD